MNEQELIKRLNSIAQYSLEDVGGLGHYEPNNQLVEQGEHSWGEWVKIEDVVKALGLSLSWNGKIVKE